MKSSSSVSSKALDSAGLRIAVSEIDLAAVRRRLALGATLTARVLEDLGKGRYTVGFAGLKMVAESTAELPVGSKLQVQVAALEPKIHLRMNDASDPKGIERAMKDLGVNAPPEDLRRLAGEMMSRGLPLTKAAIERGLDAMRQGMTPQEAARWIANDRPLTEATVARAGASTQSIAAPLERLTALLVKAGREPEAAMIRDALQFKGDASELFIKHPLRLERRLLAESPAESPRTPQELLQDVIRSSEKLPNAKEIRETAARLIQTLADRDGLRRTVVEARLMMTPKAAAPAAAADGAMTRMRELSRSAAADGERLVTLLSGKTDGPSVVLRRALLGQGADELFARLGTKSLSGEIDAAVKPAEQEPRALLVELAREGGRGDKAERTELGRAAQELLEAIEGHYLLGDPEPQIPFVVEDDGLKDGNVSAERKPDRTFVRFRLETSRLGPVAGVLDFQKATVGLAIGVQADASRKALRSALPTLSQTLSAFGFAIDAATVDLLATKETTGEWLSGLDVRA